MKTILGVPRHVATLLLSGFLIASVSISLLMIRSGSVPSADPHPAAPTHVPTAQSTDPQDAKVVTPPQPPPRKVTFHDGSSMEGITYTAVDINFDNLPPSQAADALSEATGARISVSSARIGTSIADNKFSAHIKDAPLLSAVLGFSANSRAYSVQFNKQRISLVVQLEDSQGPIHTLDKWSAKGPFAVALASTRRTPAELQLGLNFYAEPDMPVLSFPSMAVVDSAVDDAGAPLEITQQPNNGTPISSSSPAIVRQTLHLVHMRPEAMTIDHLRGHATYVLYSETGLIQTTAPDDHAVEHIGGMDVEMLPMTRLPPAGTSTLMQYTVQVRYRRGTMAPDQWASLVPALRKFVPRALGPEQQPIHLLNFASQTHEADDAELLTFKNPGGGNTAPGHPDPHHLILDIHLGARSVDFPFELTHIPIPGLAPEFEGIARRPATSPAPVPANR